MKPTADYRPLPGESGKEILASAIRAFSDRARNRFVPSTAPRCPVSWNFVVSNERGSWHAALT
jgi:DNA-binding NtrC family response regulator